MARSGPAGRSRRWIIFAAAAGGVVFFGVVYLAAHAYWTSSQTVAGTVPGEVKPWRLEVVNASGESGLALRVADHLRRLGYDVVDIRTQRTPVAARTSFIDRSGSPEALKDLQSVLELTPERFRSELDRTLMLDVTVIVGSDLRAIPAFAATARP